VRNCKKTTKKIYYCHTPPRYLYDLNELYLWKVHAFARPIFKIAFYIFRKAYERDIKKVDLILTNSINTQKRIKTFLGLESKVLYPPVDTKEFQYISTDDYYLSFARLSTVKRVDRIVKAFQQMPLKKLIVIYGENDPQRQEIFDLAQWYTNIELLTLPGNIWFTDYVGKCIATIYIPVDEDFGMSPVESMAAGKPVLWVDEWGLKESIIHEKTGYLISEKAEIDEIIDAVKYLDRAKCLEMKADCEKRASDFGLSSFANDLKKHVQ
jgi:glycosyltransferase involved in cell wall biosynthesis